MRFLKHDMPWRTMTDDEKVRCKSEIVNFYMQRMHSEDLNWDWLEDDVFTEGPLKGLTRALFYLDFCRVAHVRSIAVIIRCGWDQAERNKWRRERTPAEANDDSNGGFDQVDTVPAVEGRWTVFLFGMRNPKSLTAAAPQPMILFLAMASRALRGKETLAGGGPRRPTRAAVKGSRGTVLGLRVGPGGGRNRVAALQVNTTKRS
jgi:hypothetical protein